MAHGDRGPDDAVTCRVNKNIAPSHFVIELSPPNLAVSKARIHWRTRNIVATILRIHKSYTMSARHPTASPDPQEGEQDSAIASIRAESTSTSKTGDNPTKTNTFSSPKASTPQTNPRIQPSLRHVRPKAPPQTISSPNIHKRRPLPPRTRSRQTLRIQPLPDRLRCNRIPIQRPLTDHK